MHWKQGSVIHSWRHALRAAEACFRGPVKIARLPTWMSNKRNKTAKAEPGEEHCDATCFRSRQALATKTKFAFSQLQVVAHFIVIVLASDNSLLCLSAVIFTQMLLKRKNKITCTTVLFSPVSSQKNRT